MPALRAPAGAAMGGMAWPRPRHVLTLILPPRPAPHPDGNGGPPMRAFVRAAFAAALVLLLSVPAIAADKAFKRADLADAAIKLEAQIKAESGEVTKPMAGQRQEVDAAFQRGDDRGGVRILGQIVAIAPDRSVTWLRLARDLRQLRPSDYREKALLLERAAAAASAARTSPPC